MGPTHDDIRRWVRERYTEVAQAAKEGTGGGCCDPSCCDPSGREVFGGTLYSSQQRGALPETAVLASLGCGNPVAVADLHEGEVVLDLGCGGGIDVLLSARRVGPAGRVYGLDMTDDMLALARRNADEAGVDNVTFLRGRIEDIPLPAASVDVVISNCVVNLSPDKPAVMREVARVLVAGGRIGISDVVAEDRLSPGERAERGDWAGCIAGALSVSEYREVLRGAGFEEVDISLTHEVRDGLHGAIIRARTPRRAVAPPDDAGGCCAPDCCA